jgi:cytochrome P450
MTDVAAAARLADFPSPELMQCPYPLYDAGRAERVLRLPGRDEYAVFGHREIAWVLQHEDRFTALIPDAHTSVALDVGEAIPLGAQDGAAHKANRELLSRPFTPGRLRGYEPMIRRYSDLLIDRFVDRGSVELVAELAYPLPALVISDLMGLPTEGERFEFLKRWNVAFTRAGPQPEHEYTLMHDYLATEIQARLENPTDDILSDFLARQTARDGELDADLASCFAAEMIAAGVVTTGQMIANTMLLLLRSPDELGRARANPSRIVAALEESLRVEAPVQWRRRYTRVDVDLGGVTIPAGSLVTLVFGSGNRDEDVFECPAELRPGRANVKRHLAFGLGAHYCLGAPLARLEGRIALERLFDRLDDIRLATPEAKRRNIDSVMFRAPETLELAFTTAAA